MKQYHTILWDVDGTLLDFGKSERYAVTVCLERFGIVARKEMLERYSLINEGCWKRLERGEVTREEILCYRFHKLFEEYGITHIRPEAFEEIYQNELGNRYFFRDDSLTLCRRLRGSFRQFVVTNGVLRTQRKKLALSGLDLLMDDIFISDQIGYLKPDIKFFEECFRRIPEFDRERTIIVGDSLTSDMKGGNNAGIACCWYNPEAASASPEVKLDYEIRNLWEVLPILDFCCKEENES